MTRLKRIAAVVAAVALTFGLSAGQISASPTDATLQAGAGTQCGITVLPTDAISFGTFIFDSASNQYKPQTLLSNLPIFALQITSNAPLGTCDIAASGTNLVNTVDNTKNIPVNRVSLAQGAAVGPLLTQITGLLGLGANDIPVSSGVTLSGSQQLVVNDGLILLGTGIVVIQGALQLTGTDHSLPPGSYTGTITFTGATTITP